MIGTAMRNTKLRIGAKSTISGHIPVKTAAKTPQTSVAKWLFTCPMNILAKLDEYNVNVDY